MLLAAFGHRRLTVDADALVRNLAGDRESVIARVAEVASLPGDDGVEYLTGTATASVIRDDALDAGIRVVMAAQLATAQAKLRLDVDFGCAALGLVETPGPGIEDGVIPREQPPRKPTMRRYAPGWYAGGANGISTRGLFHAMEGRRVESRSKRLVGALLARVETRGDVWS